MHETPSRVLIPQWPTEAARDGTHVRKHFDLRDAKRYGSVAVCVGDTVKPWDQECADQMEAAVEAAGDNAHILAIGNPSIIALAAAAYALRYGRVSVLQYQRYDRVYQLADYEFLEEETKVSDQTLPQLGQHGAGLGR